MTLTLFTDGGSRGNPGPAAAGVVLMENSAVVKREGKYLGERTNNQAEYEAVILGLTLAQELGATELDVFCDSELIVHQLNRKYKVKDKDLASLFVKAWNLTQLFSRCTFTPIPREKNKEADAVVNETLDSAQNAV